MSIATTRNIIAPDKTVTLDDFVRIGKADQMTYSTFALFHKCDSNSNIHIAADNVLYDYLDEIKEKKILLTLTDLELIKYRYKPKLLSYDIYGSTELYFILLLLNNMYNIKDFNKQNLYVLYQSDLFNLLNDIYSAESSYITKFNANNNK